jgi:hypothetical protein
MNKQVKECKENSNKQMNEIKKTTQLWKRKPIKK